MHECNSGGETAGLKCNQLLDAVVTILVYNKITFDHDICIKVSADVTVSYLTLSTDDFLNTNKNNTEFPELRIVFEEGF